MPELPEVETTRRGIEPYLVDQKIKSIKVYDSRLRWPVSEEITSETRGLSVESIDRRGKYLLLETKKGTIIFHLGMSGSLRIVDNNTARKKHDHIDLILNNDQVLRFHDPRRFGACLWTSDDPHIHPLLKHLGPEPWDESFTAKSLYQQSRKRTLAIKNFIMDSKIVVGVGNIYANEALFKSGILPNREAGKVSLARYEKLVPAIQEILTKAIQQGGTTLRDFVNSSGQPGYFKQELFVYGKAGQPCQVCKTQLKDIRIGQRSSVYCSKCQR